MFGKISIPLISQRAFTIKSKFHPRLKTTVIPQFVLFSPSKMRKIIGPSIYIRRLFHTFNILTSGIAKFFHPPTRKSQGLQVHHLGVPWSDINATKSNMVSGVPTQALWFE